MLNLRSRVLSFTLLFTISAHGQVAPEVLEFVKWETKSNAVATRNDQMIPIYHYEIPYELIEKDLAKYVDKEVLSALIFKRGEQLIVRWVINPEDTKWHLEVAEWLKSKGLDATPKTYLKGHFTASRSLIVEDPQTKATFSIKVSTNNTGGHWVDKKQEFEDSREIRQASDYIKDIADQSVFKAFTPLYEPAAFGVSHLDQGMVVRTLGELPKVDKYYLPGFSALHEKEGREIAKLNGSNDPAEFWKEHYMRPLGTALAEMAAHFGFYYDSPHSQNFLIELDHKMKPTGKIVLRDFGDIYVQKEFLSMKNRYDIINSYAPHGNVVETLAPVSVGPLHGNKFPSWITLGIYDQYLKAFYESWEKRFSELTNIPRSQLEQTRMGIDGSYGYKRYPTKSKEWVAFFARMRSQKSPTSHLAVRSCQGIFLQ